MLKKIENTVNILPPQHKTNKNHSSIQEELMLSVLSKEDLLELSRKINRHLAEQYQVEENLILQMQGKLSAPLSIFSKKLSPLEALVKYLRENLHLKNCQIARTLHRDERTVWITYRNSAEKMPERFRTDSPEILIPLDIFNKRLSILESLVNHLITDKAIQGSKIAKIINKSASTVWTAKQRALKKLRDVHTKNT